MGRPPEEDTGTCMPRQGGVKTGHTTAHAGQSSGAETCSGIQLRLTYLGYPLLLKYNLNESLYRSVS